jgi:ElaB/YqjD/DUF883 family membrane-anchored ribosome-binding protein
MRNSQLNPTNALTLIGDVFAIAGAVLKSRADRGVEKLHSMSAATRDYASTLTEMPHLRAKVTAASDSMEEVANYAVRTDIEHMVTDAASFARKHPLTTIGVAAAAGVLLTALLRGAAAQQPEIKETKALSKVKAKTKPRGRIAAKAGSTKKPNGRAAHAPQ